MVRNMPHSLFVVQTLIQPKKLMVFSSSKQEWPRLCTVHIPAFSHNCVWSPTAKILNTGLPVIFAEICWIIQKATLKWHNFTTKSKKNTKTYLQKMIPGKSWNNSNYLWNFWTTIMNKRYTLCLPIQPALEHKPHLSKKISKNWFEIAVEI